MKRRVLLGVIVIVVAVAILGCILLLYNGKEEAPSDMAQQIENPQSTNSTTAGETKTPVAMAAHPKKMDEAARKARMETLRAILEAITRSGAEKTKTRELSMDPGNASESEQELMRYVRGPIGEIRPLLKGCYQRALNEDPGLSGVVRVKFSIVADEEHGGLIESSEILESGDNAAIQAMGECLRETMYALRFDKPTGAGRITVEYPMIFSTGENTPQVPQEQLRPTFEVDGFLPAE